MKTIRLSLFVLVASLLANSVFANHGPAACRSNLGHPQDALIALEIQKIAYLFGTPAQKSQAVQMYDQDFQGVGYGPAGPGRENYADVLASVGFFPTLPPGTFTLSDWMVSQAGPNTYVVSYLAVGPGPLGDATAFLQSSTWTWRGGRWKTVFFHQTLIPAP